MSKKFRLLMVLVLVTGLFGGLLTGSTVSADPVAGVRFQIPRIDLGNPFLIAAPGPTIPWDTKIQIQNLGPATTVTATFYGPYVGTGVSPLLGTQAMWLPAGGVWTLHNVLTLNFPGAESAIITTANPLVDLLAVTVDRWGSDAYDAFEISSSYTGIEDAMHGDNRYFAPYIMYRYNDLDTTLTIQNSGLNTVSVWIWYKKQGNCEYQCSQHIEVLAPGEAVRIGSGADADFPFPPCVTVTPGWLGSAYISAAEPLGIITDQLSHPPSLNRGTLTTFRGMPYKPEGYDPETGEGAWGTEWYADLLYREISGWDASIQVQNLTQVSKPTFVTVDFMDQSGDEIFFVGDWICRNGAETFYLPAIIDLGINFPFGYVGAAEIASHQQVDYPGVLHTKGEPIFVVVDLKKSKTWDPAWNDGYGGWRHTFPGETQAGAYNAHPREEKEWAYEWAMPFVAKEGNGVTTRFALRNNANCNKFYGKIWIMDETGTDVGVIHTPWLFPKHLKIIDLAYQGFLYPGFVGAARFEVLGVEQLCDTDNDGHVDNEPIMPSIVVLNYGFVAELHDPDGPPSTDLGDLTRIYEAIPFGRWEKPCDADVFGLVVDYYQDDPAVNPDRLDEVTVTITDTAGIGLCDTTGLSGMYEVEGIDIMGNEPDTLDAAAVKTGFLTRYTTLELDCGEDEELNWDLVCTVDVGFVVTDFSTASVLQGAKVTITFPNPYWSPFGAAAATITLEGISNADGVVSFAGIPGGSATVGTRTVTYKVEKDGYQTFTGGAVVLNSAICTDPEPEGVALKSLGHIQGYVWCGDGDDLYEPHEGDAPWQSVWVRVYDVADNSLKYDDYTNADGWYQFAVEPEVTYDIVVNTLKVAGKYITPDMTQVANFELCVTPHAIAYP